MLHSCIDFTACSWCCEINCSIFTTQISPAVCFLLSPAASFISGDTLRVDAGQSLYRSMWEIPGLYTPVFVSLFSIRSSTHTTCRQIMLFVCLSISLPLLAQSPSLTIISVSLVPFSFSLSLSVCLSLPPQNTVHGQTLHRGRTGRLSATFSSL